MIQKNQITLLKAIRDIDDIELIIIGYGSQEKILKDLSSKFPKEDMTNPFGVEVGPRPIRRAFNHFLKA